MSDDSEPRIYGTVNGERPRVGDLFVLPSGPQVITNVDDPEWFAVKPAAMTPDEYAAAVARNNARIAAQKARVFGEQVPGVAIKPVEKAN